MEIRHVRYFAAAAEELNLTRASQKLNISQPAVSRLIRELEGELGTALFVRERFGLSLTPAGEKFLDYARQILDISDEAVRIVGNVQMPWEVLNIGFSTTPIGAFLAAILRGFREINPGVVFKMHELAPGAQAKALRNHQIDIAFLGNPGGVLTDEFETMPLYEMRLEAVISASHRLAGQKQISLKELEREDFIGYSEESLPGRNRLVINACRLAGFTPSLRYQVDSLVEALIMIGYGVGVSLMPADAAKIHQHHTLFVSVHEKMEPYPFVAAWRRGSDSPRIRALVEYTKDYLKANEAVAPKR
jgi:DNA-binding transcriptional LysR family regulator